MSKQTFDDLIDPNEDDNLENPNTDRDYKEPPVIGLLKGEKNDVSEVVIRQVRKEVDPSRCKPWKYHNRNAAWYTAERCKDLIKDFSDGNKQLEAGIVRKIHNDPNYDYEVIAGMRRRYAKEYCNQSYLVEVRENLSDQDAISIMLSENLYQGVTKIEDGLNYLKMLKDGVYDSVKSMSEKTKKPRTDLIRMMRCAQIYSYPSINPFMRDTPKIKQSLLEKIYFFYTPKTDADTDADADSDADADADADNQPVNQNFAKICDEVFQQNRDKDDSEQIFDNDYLKLLLKNLEKEDDSSLIPYDKKKVELSTGAKLVLSMNKKGVVCLQFDYNKLPSFDEDYTATQMMNEIAEMIGTKKTKS